MTSDPCNCVSTCGDVDDEEGTCKVLQRPPDPPLVEIVLVHRDCIERLLSDG